MELTTTLRESADEPTTAVIGLAGSATIMDGGELKETLVGALAAAERVLLDVGGITEADVSVLQLLCSARRTAEEAGRKLALAPGASGAFTVVAIAAGFSPAESFGTDNDIPLREE